MSGEPYDVEIIIDDAIEAVQRGIEQLPRALGDAAQLALEQEGGHYAVVTVREQAAKKKLIARGDYWRDWDFNVTRIGPDKVGCEIINYQPEVMQLTIEHGRRPNSRFPPRQAIIEWMDVRNIRPSAGETEDAVAFLIARKIARDGIPAKRVVESAFKIIDRRSDLVKIIAKYMDRPLADVFSGARDQQHVFNPRQ